MTSPTAERGSIGDSGEQFGWPLARLACSVHESFAWNGPAVDPKTCVPLERSWGERHRLSLVAQFAAHQAFLAFAGLGDGPFDAAEWTVVKARGSDVRLLRIAATGETDWSGATPFDHAVRFARFLEIDDLPALERPWGRADHVYAEARVRLTDGNAADLTALNRAAFGAVLNPGAEELDQLLTGPALVRSEHAVAALRNMARLSGRHFVSIGGAAANPLLRGSGCGSLLVVQPGLSLDDPELVVEALLDMKNALVVVEQPQRLDPFSRTVVGRLIDEERQIAIADESFPRESLPVVDGRTRLFAISPSAEAMRALLARFSVCEKADELSELEQLCASEAYDAFLSFGTVPSVRQADDATTRLVEPARSFLGALSLLGREVDLELASRFLAGIGALVTPVELGHPGVATISSGKLVFESDEVCLLLQRHLSAEMVESLVASALELLDDAAPLSRGRLARRVNDRDGALRALEDALQTGTLDDCTVTAELRAGAFRVEELRDHDLLATLEAEALCGRGAYRSALVLAEGIESARARLIAARCCRRLGRYGEALEFLAETETRFASALLTGVLQRLEGSHELATDAFERAESLASDESERARLEFERAILAIDMEQSPKTAWKRKAEQDHPWLVARFDAYQALWRGEYETAADRAALAITSAPDLFERIDAHVDLVYAHFMAGEWDRASTVARETLQLIEETEGDRAGGGVLYTLAYLSADEGRWREAEALLRKLESFYQETHDERRSRELELIRAQIALGKLDYAEARRAASRVEQCDSTEIRYAAKLILDELDWIDGSLPMPRVDGHTGCAELERRSRLIRVRAGEEMELDEFSRQVHELEQSAINGDPVEIPEPTTSSQRLTLIRSLDALQRRLGNTAVFEEPLARLCEAAGIDRRVESKPAAQRLLIALSKSEMPPPEVPIAGVDWRFAVRNRLGVWRQYGSLPHCESKQLEIIAVDDDVLRIGDSGLLWLEGEIEWSEDLREAVADLWRVKWEHRNLVRLNEQMASTVRDDVPVSEDGIIGESAALREALRPLPFAARSELAVTIEGETGTGKELVARAIHRRSPRRSRAFTPVNCGALPENLVESELFGHVRGAFTGADRDRIGLIEATDGGTLFLDEIGEMPLPAQAKLLRFVQDGEFRRVGETETRTADVRIIAATNRKLETEVDEGRFRQDLYYRIKGIEIPLPPLRRRGNDVILLARKFLADARAAAKAGPSGFTEDVESLLLGYQWEGNVRDLQNVVSWAFSLAGDAPLITIDHLPQRVCNAAARASKRGNFYEELAQFRRQMIEQSLLEASGNQSRAAKTLGMTRQALSYQIKELGIHVRKQVKRSK